MPRESKPAEQLALQAQGNTTMQRTRTRKEQVEGKADLRTPNTGILRKEPPAGSRPHKRSLSILAGYPNSEILEVAKELVPAAEMSSAASVGTLAAAADRVRPKACPSPNRLHQDIRPSVA